MSRRISIIVPLLKSHGSPLGASFRDVVDLDISESRKAAEVKFCVSPVLGRF